MVSTVASAHDHPNLKRGVNGASLYDFSQIEAINLFNGQLSLRIPIVSYHVDGSLSYSITLQYSSNIFDFESDGGESLSVPNPHSNAGLGWMVFFDELYGPFSSPVNDTSFWVMVDGDGSRHLFYASLHEGEASASHYRYSRDGSYLRMRCVESTGDCAQSSNLSAVEIESPDGLIRVFEDDPEDAQQWRKGRLTEIRDRFGNSISFTYTNTASERSWEIGDGHRTTKVYFDLSHGQVDRVEAPAFDGTTAIYRFGYGDGSIGSFGNQTPVKLLTSLTSLTLPDSFTWTMQYDPDYTGNPRISRLTLPTGGSYEWDYAPYLFPGTTYQQPLGSTVGVGVKRTFGVDGTTKTGEWQYLRDPFPPTSEVSTTVRSALELSPLVQNDTRYHFRDSHALAEPHWTHGLPLTFNTADPMGERYLSVEYYEGLRDPGDPQPDRTEYVRFTADATSNGLGSHLNQRLEKRRTVYHDDGDSFINLTLSDFDGLGHFRTVNRNGLGDPSGRTQSTGYNPGAGAYDCTSSAGPVTCTGPFNLPSTSAAWILYDYDLSSQAEGGDVASQLYCFDQTTGFLTRVWTQQGSLLEETDVVYVRTPDANGNLAREEFFGGDGASLPTTGDHCTASLGAPDYRIDHTYAYGSLETSRYRDSAGGGGPNDELDFFVVDHTDAGGGTGIDQSTGLVSSSKDVSGILTTYEYDSLGRLTQAIPESGHGGRTKHVYTPFDPSSGGLARVVTQYRNAGNTASLAVRRLYFDGLGRVAQEGLNVAGQGAQTRGIEYNGVGWLTSVSGLGFPTNKTQYLNYDAFGRPTKIRPPDGMGHDVDLAYAGVREVERTVRIELAAGEAPVQTAERYDEQGRLVEVEEALSSTSGSVTTRYAYDIGSRLESVTMRPGPGQQMRTFNYDHRGFLTSETHPETGTIAYSGHDARGWPGGMTVGGHSRSFTYDGAERLRQVDADGLAYKTFSYGTVADGGEKLGRLVEAMRHNYVDWDGSGIVDLPVAETYTYGGKGGRITRRDTVISRVGTFTQEFAYNDLRLTQSLEYPCFGTGGVCDSADPADPRQVEQTFTQGFLTGITGYTSITYHPNGHVHQVQNQVQSSNPLDLVYCMASDGIQRPSGITLDSANPRDPDEACMSPSLAYAYDGAGNVTQMGSESYHYDEFGRIEHVTTGTPNTQDYEYDDFGNLIGIDTQRQGQPLDERDWPVNSKNQLSAGTYDASGNLIQYQNASTALSLDWDALGTMTGASSGSVDFAYVYTAQDERVAVKEQSFFGDFVTTTLRGLDGLVLREYVDSSSDDIMSDGFESGDLDCWSSSVGGPPAGGGCPKPGLTWRRDHVYRNGQLLASELPPPNGRVFHYLNHLGTPVLVADASGGVIQGEGDFFFPFGESQDLNDPVPLSPLRYTGHLRDQNGLTAIWDDLDQMHARYYGSHFGRFMSPDPIVAANPRFPQSWNQYAYVFDNPVKFVDPTGLAAEGFSDEITVSSTPIDAREPGGGLLGLLALLFRPRLGGGGGSPPVTSLTGERAAAGSDAETPCSTIGRAIDTLFPLKISGTLSPTVLGPAAKLSLTISPDGSVHMLILGGVGAGGSGKLKFKPLMHQSGGETPVGLVFGGDIAVLLGVVPTGAFQLPLVARGDSVADISAGLGANSFLSFMLGLGPSFPVFPATREPCR